MTHKEKDELIKALKEKLKAATELLDRKTTGDFDSLGVSAYFDEDRNEFVLVEIEFDSKSDSARIKNRRYLGNSRSTASVELKRTLFEKIFSKI